LASLFTRIMRGELPARFVWRDPRAVAFLTIAPLRPGHTLVVPVREVDHWLDLEPDLLAHLTGVAQVVGRALQRAYDPPKVGLMLVGIEVPHVHFHVVPIWGVRDMDFANADSKASAESLDAAAAKLRGELRALGRAEVAG
jgi:diadenosine tetraphosphate (Ap4A) HIT family hydrolase